MALAYAEEWAVKLQERLDYNTVWKEVCRVEYTDTRVLHNPYRSTVPAVQTGTRGTAYTHQSYADTDESITISTYYVLPMFIDRADLAQSRFNRQMDLAELQGQLINEKVESAMLASHASFTDFDNASIGGAAGNISVSASNIDDIIRGIKREISEANGDTLADRNGIFIIWRAADFEILEAFMQANGFVTADTYLRNGTVTGMNYMGVTHYKSNLHTSGHLFAGVKKVFHLGICKSTYGQVVIDQEPALNGSGAASGIGVISRIDLAFKAWTLSAGLLFDVLVA